MDIRLTCCLPSVCCNVDVLVQARPQLQAHLNVLIEAGASVQGFTVCIARWVANDLSIMLCSVLNAVTLRS